MENVKQSKFVCDSISKAFGLPGLDELVSSKTETQIVDNIEDQEQRWGEEREEDEVDEWEAKQRQIDIDVANAIDKDREEDGYGEN